MTTSYYSAVLDQPLETVWSLIRDFNNYPAYIDGVSESVIDDDRRVDEVGAVRHFWRLARRPQVESGRSKEMSYTPPLSLAW